MQTGNLTEVASATAPERGLLQAIMGTDASQRGTFCRCRYQRKITMASRVTRYVRLCPVLGMA